MLIQFLIRYLSCLNHSVHDLLTFGHLTTISVDALPCRIFTLFTLLGTAVWISSFAAGATELLFTEPLDSFGLYIGPAWCSTLNIFYSGFVQVK